MAIKENATVKVIGGFYEGQTGKVARVYPYLNTATVAIDGVDRLVKIRMDALEEVNVKIEIPEGAKLISHDEFMEAIGQVTKHDKIVEKVGADMSFLVGMTVMIGALKLVERLFKESKTIVITKDQLLRAIAECVADEDPKFMIVGLTNGLILRGVVDILFGAEDGK
jgi:hypothetical protein